MVFGDREMKENQTINSMKSSVRNHWLMLLIVMQPVLDILAFWTKSPDGTLSGYIRLLVMIALPIYLLFTIKDKKELLRFVLSMCIIALVCALHIANCMRLGCVSLSFDVSYAAKTAQMPILAVCFMHCIKNEQTRNQAYWGLFFAAAITALSIGLAWITGTANVTYGDGLGISGWVIDDNRCANSVIVVTLAAFSVFCSSKTDKAWINILVPVIALVVLLSNGTKACYYGVYVIFAGFALFMIAEKLIKGTELKKPVVITLLCLSVVAVIVTPITPMYKVKNAQDDFAQEVDGGFESKLQALGYDLDSMTTEEKLANPIIMSAYEEYYYSMFWQFPNIFDRFTIEEIALKYDMTTDPEILMNTRQLKSTYAALLRDNSDTATKLFGIDVSDIWLTGGCDLENDWPAIYYYYGIVGIAAYGAFMLYFVWLIIRRLMKNFKTAFTTDNFILLVTFALFIGLAQFSGSVLRRPNVSFYMALVLGLIYYQTKIKPADEENNLWRELQ
jgi:hypothetical protein